MGVRVEGKVCRDYRESSKLEWILTNGIGGYAMGTVSGSLTRKYQGHLVAATDPPTERTVLLASIEAYVTVGGQPVGLSTNQYVGAVYPQGYALIESFEVGEHAHWVYRVGKNMVSKRLAMHAGENACTVVYTNESSEPLQLTLRPLVCHKFYHDTFRVADFYPQFLVFPDDRILIVHDSVTLCLEHPQAERTASTGWYYRFEMARDAERGLDPLEDLYCPGELRYFLAPGECATLVASTQKGTPPLAIPENSPNGSVLERMKRAAKMFLVSGPDVRPCIIAGYPWFTDWGRDTMISLPGLCLCTGEIEMAKSILRSYAAAMDQGLVPNRFDDRGDRPEYNTADATLWFANAVFLTVEADPHDKTFAEEALGWLRDALDWIKKGTHFGIGLDPADGLMTQGAPGYQLTWMDAKVGDWVVTPRHGKPVEVNGLFVNFLRILESLSVRLGQSGDEFRDMADKATDSMQQKFWKASLGHYLDTIDPADASLRPNQLIAMGLPFSPLTGPNAVKALDVCRRKLLTADGLRTLAPSEPHYKGRYEGSMSERDAAYHQGTVWPWLIGPYVSAVLKLTGDVEEAQSVLSRADEWLDRYGLDGVPEVYDGDEPRNPGGCPWQAWSLAEIIRAMTETAKFIK